MEDAVAVIECSGARQVIPEIMAEVIERFSAWELEL